MYKKTAKAMAGLGGVVAGLLITYLFFAFVLTVIPAHRDFREAKEGVDLYLVSNGVHVALCFPLRESTIDWSACLDLHRFGGRAGRAQYLSVGWGERAFYLNTPAWSDLTFTTAARAAFLPSPAAMHTTLLHHAPRPGRLVRSVRISRSQLEVIEQFIFSYLKQENGKAVLIDPSRYPAYGGDLFYEAHGAYTLFRTCNTWTNQALKKAGIKTAVWTPFDRSVLYHFDP